MIRYWLLNPVVAFLLAFAATHGIFGVDIYLEHDELFWLSTIFFCCLVGSALVVALFSSESQTTNDSSALIWMRVVRQLEITSLVALLIKLALVGYAILTGTIGFHSMRREISDVVPQMLLLPVDMYASAAFAVVVAYYVVRCRQISPAVSRTVLFFLVFSVTGSRSLSLFFPFVFVLVLYYANFVRMRGLLALAAMLVLVGGMVSVERLNRSENMYEQNWYAEREILIEDALFESAYNIVAFQILDMVRRTHRIIDGVPARLDHQSGKSIFFGFYSLLPGKQINPAVKIHHDLFETSPDMDTPFPPTTVAQLWLDFGLAGVVIGGAFFGALGQYLFVRARRSGDPADVSILISYLYCFLLSLYGDFEAFRFFVLFVLIKSFYYLQLSSRNEI